MVNPGDKIRVIHRISLPAFWWQCLWVTPVGVQNSELPIEYLSAPNLFPSVVFLALQWDQLDCYCWNLQCNCIYVWGRTAWYHGIEFSFHKCVGHMKRNSGFLFCLSFFLFFFTSSLMFSSFNFTNWKKKTSSSLSLHFHDNCNILFHSPLTNAFQKNLRRKYLGIIHPLIR